MKSEGSRCHVPKYHQVATSYHIPSISQRKSITTSAFQNQRGQTFLNQPRWWESGSLGFFNPKIFWKKETARKYISNNKQLPRSPFGRNWTEHFRVKPRPDFMHLSCDSCTILCGAFPVSGHAVDGGLILHEAALISFISLAKKNRDYPTGVFWSPGHLLNSSKCASWFCSEPSWAYHEHKVLNLSFSGGEKRTWKTWVSVESQLGKENAPGQEFNETMCFWYTRIQCHQQFSILLHVCTWICC